jgi:hypothetical protein
MRATITTHLEQANKDIAKLSDPLARLEALTKITTMIGVLNKSVEGAAKLVASKTDTRTDETDIAALMEDLHKP